MFLTTVQEIERAIAALTPQELSELYAWLDSYGSEFTNCALADGSGSGSLRPGNLTRLE